jgi:hypothetical protein
MTKNNKTRCSNNDDDNPAVSPHPQEKQRQHQHAAAEKKAKRTRQQSKREQKLWPHHPSKKECKNGSTASSSNDTGLSPQQPSASTEKTPQMNKKPATKTSTNCDKLKQVATSDQLKNEPCIHTNINDSRSASANEQQTTIASASATTTTTVTVTNTPQPTPSPRPYLQSTPKPPTRPQTNLQPPSSTIVLESHLPTNRKSHLPW